jgi:hypothetical protein
VRALSSRQLINLPADSGSGLRSAEPRCRSSCGLCDALEDGGDGGDGVELVGGGADLRVVASSLIRGSAAGRTRTGPTRSVAESHRLEPD